MLHKSSPRFSQISRVFHKRNHDPTNQHVRASGGSWRHLTQMVCGSMWEEFILIDRKCCLVRFYDGVTRVPFVIQKVWNFIYWMKDKRPLESSYVWKHNNLKLVRHLYSLTFMTGTFPSDVRDHEKWYLIVSMLREAYCKALHMCIELSRIQHNSVYIFGEEHVYLEVLMQAYHNE